VGLTMDWNRNKHTNQLDFSYNKKSHSEDSIRSFILGLRLFIQDNEIISLHKMKLLYGKMNIVDKYKVHFNYLRDELNRYLDMFLIAKCSSVLKVISATLDQLASHSDPIVLLP
jgi:hypothetical protein